MKKYTVLLFLIFISVIGFAQSITKTMNLLPDTGQTGSYTTTYGEDNDYTINPPLLTNNGNGTITDTATGLMWQQTDAGEMTVENAATYCDNLIFGGFSDWRLPNAHEAFSILNHQYTNPAINTTYFTITAAEYWWTSVYQANDASKVWCTNAGGGIGNHPKSETVSAGGVKKFHARAVRNTNIPTTITHFTNNGDGTVTDNVTQLIWQKIPNTNLLTWENALTYAENLSLAGALNWRLPNIKELQSLNDETFINPSVNTAFFSTIGSKNYWSSTTLPNQTNKAWYYNTQFGITTYDTKTNTDYVICVKGTPVILAGSSFSIKTNSHIYPNPFSSKISIENANPNDSFELYNEIGKQIFIGKFIETQDFSGLSKGIYFLKINSETISTITLIKQ